LETDVVAELERWIEAIGEQGRVSVDMMFLQHARDEIVAQRERCAWLGQQVEEIIEDETHKDEWC
jgi:hypothetical protein